MFFVTESTEPISVANAQSAGLVKEKVQIEPSPSRSPAQSATPNSLPKPRRMHTSPSTYSYVPNPFTPIVGSTPVRGGVARATKDKEKKGEEKLKSNQPRSNVEDGKDIENAPGAKFGASVPAFKVSDQCIYSIHTLYQSITIERNVRKQWKTVNYILYQKNFFRDFAYDSLRFSIVMKFEVRSIAICLITTQF